MRKRAEEQAEEAKQAGIELSPIHNIAENNVGLPFRVQLR